MVRSSSCCDSWRSRFRTFQWLRCAAIGFTSSSNISSQFFKHILHPGPSTFDLGSDAKIRARSSQVLLASTGWNSGTGSGSFEFMIHHHIHFRRGVQVSFRSIPWLVCVFQQLPLFLRQMVWAAAIESPSTTSDLFEFAIGPFIVQYCQEVAPVSAACTNLKHVYAHFLSCF